MTLNEFKDTLLAQTDLDWDIELFTERDDESLEAIHHVFLERSADGTEYIRLRFKATAPERFRKCLVHDVD